jgi:hypothetical protein
MSSTANTMTNTLMKSGPLGCASNPMAYIGTETKNEIDNSTSSKSDGKMPARHLTYRQ